MRGRASKYESESLGFLLPREGEERYVGLQSIALGIKWNEKNLIVLVPDILFLVFF